VCSSDLLNSTNRNFSNENESLHYVVGRPTDLAALASAGQTTANYALQTFTTPTDAVGGLGTFNDARFEVDIGFQEVSGYVDIAHTGNDYEISFFGVNTFNGGQFSDSANVYSSSSCFSAGCTGDVTGLVAGPDADRAGLVSALSASYELT